MSVCCSPQFRRADRCKVCHCPSAPSRSCANGSSGRHRNPQSTRTIPSTRRVHNAPLSRPRIQARPRSSCKGQSLWWNWCTIGHSRGHRSQCVGIASSRHCTCKCNHSRHPTCQAHNRCRRHTKPECCMVRTLVEGQPQGYRMETPRPSYSCCGLAHLRRKSGCTGPTLPSRPTHHRCKSRRIPACCKGQPLSGSMVRTTHLHQLVLFGYDDHVDAVHHRMYNCSRPNLTNCPTRSLA